jgi:hypothetical protein
LKSLRVPRFTSRAGEKTVIARSEATPDLDAGTRLPRLTILIHFLDY